MRKPSSTPRAYAFIDAALPTAASPILYYRLRQVDTDGPASYSPVRAVAGAAGATGLVLFPNPAATAVTVAWAAPGAAVRVFDPLGRVVLAAEADATGRAVLRWPAATMAAGVYLVRAGRASARLSVTP